MFYFPHYLTDVSMLSFSVSGNGGLGIKSNECFSFLPG